MRVFLDDQIIEVAQPTLAAALDTVRAAALGRKRVIIQASVDGAPVPDDALESPSTQPLTGVAEVRFLSAEPRSLVKTAMLEVRDALSSARESQKEAAELIAVGKTQPALEHLFAAIGVWEAVRRVVDEGPRLLNADVAGVTAAGAEGTDEPVARHIAAMGKSLGDLKTALSTQDWSTLGDLLSEDLDQLAGRWQGVLTRLAEAMAKA